PSVMSRIRLRLGRPDERAGRRGGGEHEALPALAFARAPASRARVRGFRPRRAPAAARPRRRAFRRKLKSGGEAPAPGAANWKDADSRSASVPARLCPQRRRRGYGSGPRRPIFLYWNKWLATYDITATPGFFYRWRVLVSVPDLLKRPRWGDAGATMRRARESYDFALVSLSVLLIAAACLSGPNGTGGPDPIAAVLPHPDGAALRTPAIAALPDPDPAPLRNPVV